MYYKPENQFDVKIIDNFGNGIYSTEYIKSDGLEDIYRIYYTNGTYAEFTVTNGKDGADGKDGEKGSDGTDGKSAFELLRQNTPPIRVLRLSGWKPISALRLRRFMPR